MVGTTGRYVTVVGPNRIYPNPDNLYLTLCEVAVYGNCPPLPDAAMGGTLSATAAAAAASVAAEEALGKDCQITMGTDSLSFVDAEHACKLEGGHLASIHNEQEAEHARALLSNSPWAAQGEAWCVRTSHPQPLSTLLRTFAVRAPAVVYVSNSYVQVMGLLQRGSFPQPESTLTEG